MSVLLIKNLAHRFGDKVLYRESNLELNAGEHLGVVGPNGAGKSTLFQIINDEVDPDGGTIIWQEKAKVGYLDQQAKLDQELSIFDYLKGVYIDLFITAEKLENNLKKLEEDYNEKLLKKVLRDQDILAENNFGKLDSQIRRVAAGLGLTVLGLERKIGSLSGGQRAKVILAKLLLENPDVLLLDEPTNFLDKEHVSWLSLYLKSFPGAILLISHDVGFLNEVVDHVAALEGGEIHKYRGNYSAYLAQKALKQQTQSGLREKQQKLIAKTKDYIERNGARASTAKQAQSRQKMLNKLEIIEPPENAKPPRFSFALAKGAHGNSLNLNSLVVGYDKPLLPALDFSIKDGEKVAITGFNGIGKSTLLKTIIGEIPALAGSGRFACNIVLNYFAQDLKWQEPRLTPLEIMMASFPETMPGDLRGKLALCTIKSEHVRQPIMSLSGGEQAKVKLARMMLKPSNFLILDEPTNHLDVLAKSALKKAIADFAGAVILVSHETEFYEDLVDRVLEIEKLI